MNLHDWQKNQISSRLNWQVDKEEIFDKRGKKLPVFATFRSDNHSYLGTVTDGYSIVQNDELFKMPEALIKAGMNVEFAGAGEIDGGERVFVKYKLPMFIDVRKVGDIVNAFLLSSTRHDGRGSVITKTYFERLVCTNGMTSRSGHAMQFARHTAKVNDKIEDMRIMLGKVGQDVENYSALANTLASVDMKMDDIREVIELTYKKSDTNNIYTNTRAQDKARAVLAKFEANDNDQFKKQRGTAWNLYNAFTNYVDHEQNFRPSSNETAEQAKFRGTLFGAGEQFKWHALLNICHVVSKNYSVNFPKEFIEV